MEQLVDAPQGEEIDFLYSVIRHQDPDFLRAFDQRQFADTPLHFAADNGRTQLAVEIQRLMPSLGRKLNPDGFTAVDLALRRGHRETARAMVKLNPELVGVHGREGITPLHYAAETDDADLLEEFLLRYPKSIEELTARGESAVHLAVKYEKLAAFRVMFDWVVKTGRTDMLRWKDGNGDTVVHLAASTNQPQVLERLGASEDEYIGEGMGAILGAPEEDDIVNLYLQIRQDRDFLHAYEKRQFTDTPLHLAAGQGCTQLALEIERLMPSFGRMLNRDGLTPVDLALQQGYRETVRAMVKLDPELVRVQGREGITPLHYATEMDDADLLKDFLASCPESIEELTVREESAVHVAVKNGKLVAFRVMLDWLIKTDGTEILEWKDCNGNTALHVAASTNQPQVLRLLVKRTNVKEKNAAGWTALDIVKQLPAHVNGTSARLILERGEAEATCIGHIFSSPIKLFIQEGIKTCEFLERGMTGDMRNALLVVAVLIATAAYQGVLSPPGGFNQGNNGNTNVTYNNSTTTTRSFDASGKAVMSKKDFEYFMSCNSGALAFSLGVIFLLIPLTWVTGFSPVILVCGSLVYLLLGYVAAMKVISPLDVNNLKEIEFFFSLCFAVVLFVKIFVLCIPKNRNCRKY